MNALFIQEDEVPAKKAKKPSQSIRYLLFADRRLQRISLRKISDRMKGRKRVSRTRRASAPVRTPRPILPPLAIGPGAIVLGLAFAVGAAVLIGARQSAPVAVEENAAPLMDAPLELAAPVQEAERPVLPQPTRKTPAPSAGISTSPRATAARLTPAPADVARPTTPADSARPAPTDSARPATAASFARTATPAPVVAPEIPTARGDDEESPAVTTISGCLGSDGDTFRLKDTSGADVPKSRSWKSGFLKKRSVGVTLVDASRTLHLSSYVGQRVAATGTLVDREMRTRSVRRLASSCD